MCQILGVSRSAVYDWLKRPASKRELENKEILKIAKKNYNDHGKKLGLDRMLADVRKQYPACSRKRLYRIQKENQLYTMHECINTGKSAIAWLIESIQSLVFDLDKEIQEQISEFNINQNEALDSDECQSYPENIQLLRRKIQDLENTLNNINPIPDFFDAHEKNILNQRRINYFVWCEILKTIELPSEDMKATFNHILIEICDWAHDHNISWGVEGSILKIL